MTLAASLTSCCTFGFFADEAGNEAMDYVPHEKHAFSGHTWDFTTNSSTSNKMSCGSETSHNTRTAQTDNRAAQI